MKFLALWIWLLPVSLLGQRGAALLESGPMVGYAEMREVALWVQLKGPGKAQVRYREIGDKDWLKTTVQEAEAQKGYTVHLTADQVLPGKTYEAELILNGKVVDLEYPFTFQSRPLWKYGEAAPDLAFLAGSCAYQNDPPYDRPGNHYGGGYQIFEHMAKEEVDFMLWLGDNVYLREADWNTRTGIQYRYTRSRKLKELQPLLSKMSHYATWDDHDFGPNNSDRSFVHKDLTLQAFKDFWANPSYGSPDHPGGIYSQFSWSDCDFFLLDNRYFRSPNGCESCPSAHWGDEQLNWVIDALAGSRATFKFVMTGSMVLSTLDKFENTIHTHPEERKRLLDAIVSEEIEGVIFLTGDRHHTELSRLDAENGVVIYDLTVSPLTSGAYDPGAEDNDYLVEGTTVGERNFAVVQVTGESDSRQVKVQIKDKDGHLRWEHNISAPK